jgi:hypothetical protein
MVEPVGILRNGQSDRSGPRLVTWRAPAEARGLHDASDTPVVAMARADAPQTGAEPERPRRARYWAICLAFAGVIAVVSTVTTGGTEAAQSSRIDLAMSIAWLAPVG